MRKMAFSSLKTPYGREDRRKCAWQVLVKETIAIGAKLDNKNLFII